jgi:acyl-CoA thioesterase FadM
MNLYVRLLRVLLGGWFQASTHYADTTTSRFRVWLHDLDAFGHMNNGRYLQIMDVARTHWMVRSGVFGAIRRNRWAPLLGGGFIRYRFSLKMFQPYRVHSRLLCWDDRWFFLEHVFTDRKDRHVAVGITRAALRKNGNWVPTGEVVDEVHPGAESPRIPRYVREWVALEDKMYRRGSRFHRENNRPVAIREVC